ncbi:MAG: chromosome segregation protein SMC [Actinomycetota bacterium]|nr:chromosome segregation protein SMC [Actinomycetota bacterium]
MYLKSLNIKGFKSFAKKTALDFEPGVTVIVGPNGSGKSNLTDAILWVLGEQSPRSLRGSQMEDVIFTGSSSKPASGLAEVSLVLDNSDGYLPIEFAEVTVTRRMSRSGASDYFINGSSCRLIDVQDLLSDTGLGREIHCIVGQGRIDEILSSRSDEKRLLIEEVAGVLKHRKRKERAVKKLFGMDQNLLRIKDVAKEVERQLNPLKEQAKLAEKAAKLANQIKEVETSIIVFDLYSLQSEWKNTTAKVELFKSQLTELKEELLTKKDEMDSIQVELEERGDFVGDIGENRRELKGIIERFNSGLLLLEEKGKYLVEKLSDLRMQIYRLESLIKSKEEEAAQLNHKIDVLKIDEEELDSVNDEKERQAETLKKSLAKAQRDSLKIKEELTKKADLIKAKDEELGEINLKLSSLRAESDMLKGGLKAAKEGELPTAKNIERFEKNLTKLELELRKAQDETKRLELSSLNNEKELLRLTLLKRKASEELLGLEGKINSIAANLESLLLYPDSIKWLLSEVIGSEKGQLLSEVMDVKEGYEVAIEAALGDLVYSLLVADVSSVKEILDSLKNQKKGSASIIPLKWLDFDTQKGEAPKGTVLAIDVALPKKGFEGAVKAVLRGILIVKDLDEAIQMAKSRSSRFDFVTLDGDLIKKEGIIKGGLTDPKSPIAFNAQLAELRKKKSLLKKEIDDLESAIEEAEKVGGKIDEEVNLSRDILNGSLQKKSEAVLMLRSERGHLKQRQKERGRLEARLVEIDEAIREAALSEESHSFAKDGLIKDLTRLGNASLENETTLSGLEKEISALSLNLSELKAKKEAASERRAFLSEQLSALEVDLASLRENLNAGYQTVEARENLRGRIQPLHQLFTALFARAVELDEMLKSTAMDEKLDTKKSRERHKLLTDNSSLILRKIDQLQEEIGRIDVERGQLELKVTELTKRLNEDFSISLKVALSMAPKRLNLDEAHGKLAKLKLNHSKIGPVNEVAAQECSNLEERHKFLSDQMADLKRSRSSLQKVIKVIEQKMTDRFYETFELVNKHFQDIFARLFPGGEASLILTGEDDLLSCGIEIEANPLGKRLSKITLLSGGERSLVALALLFAIYHTKPSPFYVLDEVEPALDDNNLVRFLALLQGERAKTQFLIISHQRRTMEIADSLYGVSMQSDGISTVISQKLGQMSDKAS